MASYSHTLIAALLLLGLSQSSTLASAAPVHAPSTLIHQICGNKNYFSSEEQTFCYDILGSDGRANEATNVIGLAIRGYQIAEANTTRDLLRIKEVASSEKASHGLKLGLENCVVAFRNISGAYHDSQEIIRRDCIAADYKIFGIIDQISSCADQLKSHEKEVVDPFVWTSLQDAGKFMDLNKAITDLCSTKLF